MIVASSLASQGNLLVDNDASSSCASSSTSTPTKDHKVTSWATAPESKSTSAEPLRLDILKHGGLVTVEFPYNIEGAVTIRDILNEGTANKLYMCVSVMQPSTCPDKR